MDEKCSRTLAEDRGRIEICSLDSAGIRADKFKIIFKSGLQGISKMAQHGSITIDGNQNEIIDYTAKNGLGSPQCRDSLPRSISLAYILLEYIIYMHATCSRRITEFRAEIPKILKNFNSHDTRKGTSWKFVKTLRVKIFYSARKRANSYRDC